MTTTVTLHSSLFVGPAVTCSPPAWQRCIGDADELIPLVEPPPAVVLQVALNEVDRLRAERDEARAERDELRAALAASRRLRAGVTP
jgi:hypothetical protein